MPILVIVQLAGGNDGLNTVVPFEDDRYYRLRPSLAVPKDKVLRLDDHLGLNPACAGLHRLAQEGRLAIVQNVGYPNPNRSHFRSTDIWETASESNEFVSTGFVGRYFDNCCSGAPAGDDPLGVHLTGTVTGPGTPPNPLSGIGVAATSFGSRGRALGATRGRGSRRPACRGARADT